MRFKLAENRSQSLTFGTFITLCTFAPLVNLVVIPVAVCGATAMWVETYRKDLYAANGKTTSKSTALSPDIVSGGSNIVSRKGNDIISK